MQGYDVITDKSAFDPVLTVFMLVKTTVEWLGLPIETRLQYGKQDFQPILDNFKGRIHLKWYDVEFYNARVTDVWVIDAKDHHSYQLFCEKLRESPFWDRFFRIEEILPGELNAWARNYEVEPFRS